MAILEIRGISKRFGALEALSGFDLDVGEGAITSVIGPNGAGKTTLFNVVTGAYRPDSGRVVFAEEDITGKKPHHIAMAGLARSFQITNIYPRLSVWDNLALAAQTRSKRRFSVFARTNRLRGVETSIRSVLDRLGLLDMAHAPAGALSHGDQRHLEIGMALAMGPRLLMLDEPTSGMSPAESVATMELINVLRNEVTILLIEHDMDLVMNLSDRIAVLNFGYKIAEGPPGDIATNQEVQRVYLGEG